MKTVLDLFSGIGVFSLGLEAGGRTRTTTFCEINPRARQVLARHWPEVPIVHDVQFIAKQHAADIITAGFPCQDVSLAGPGTGLAGSRSSLIWQAFRAIRLARPAYVVLENVAALLGRGMGAVLGQMAEDGYDAEWDCIQAHQAGAPHRRDRVFIIANAKGHGRGPGRPGGLADGLAGLSVEPRWEGNPIDFFEERFAQPALLGMDDEAPRGLDRLGLCGNAIVEPIPRLIGAVLDVDSVNDFRHAAE